MATRYLVTSLPPAVATAARVLTLARGRVPSGRVAIENGLHYVKDVTLREDASTLHAGAGPTVLAMLRDTAVTVLHRAGVRAVASRVRYHSTHPEAALALLGIPLPEHAYALRGGSRWATPRPRPSVPPTRRDHHRRDPSKRSACSGGMDARGRS